MGTSVVLREDWLFVNLPQDRFGATVNAKLVKDVFDMLLDRLVAYPQLLCNLLIGEPPADQCSDLLFPVG
jgi:hypothetical protein